MKLDFFIEEQLPIILSDKEYVDEDTIEKVKESILNCITQIQFAPTPNQIKLINHGKE